MWGLVFVGILMAGAALFNTASKKEQKRQKELTENYEQYKEEADREYRQIIEKRKSTIQSMQRKTAAELYQIHQNALSKRKERIQPLYDKLMNELELQMKDWKELNIQTQNGLEQLKAYKSNRSNTELRQESINILHGELIESHRQQQAYISYLEKYKKQANCKFERSGNLIEPFYMKLPEGVPYIGKIISFDREEAESGDLIQ